LLKRLLQTFLQKVLRKQHSQCLNTNTEIKALMWWYDVNKQDAHKYLNTLSQSVINIIVKYFKKYKDENNSL
jgi:hypothetical protein